MFRRNIKWIFVLGFALVFLLLAVFILLKIHRTNMTIVNLQHQTPESKFKELTSKLANTNDTLAIVNINFKLTLDTVVKGVAILYGVDYKVNRDQKVITGQRSTSVLTLGGTVMNNNQEFVKKLHEIFKVDVSICVKEPEGFVRVASSLVDTSGKSGIGTLFNKANPAYAYVIAGKRYLGKSTLFGKGYFTKYEPIIIDGKVEGLLMVGVSYENFVSRLYILLGKGI